MRSASIRTKFCLFALLVFALLSALPASRGDILLNINSGESQRSASVWVEGEPSLVMNGFDLSGMTEQLPLAIDAVSISVETPVPGDGATVVVYEDATGGSPVDATLVYRQNVSITKVGDIRVPLRSPPVVSQQVAWVGFYLPVGFQFLADMSGSSSLTYWAWTPGGPFDLSSPSRAVVLGPRRRQRAGQPGDGRHRPHHCRSPQRH